MTGQRRWLRAGLPIAVVLLLGVVAAAALVPRLLPDGPDCPGRDSAAVVLDPGHGGDDPGAINRPYRLVERDLTLRIARRTASILEADGYAVALTRDDNATTLGNSERGRIANACGALVFVSIHLNSVDAPEPNHTLALWATAQTDLAFARAMQTTLAARLRPGTNLGDGGVREFESGALLRARMPATLVEAVFLSNPEEAARLAEGTSARLEEIAAAIAAGIEAWL